MEKLGLQLQELKIPTAFTQLDGSLAGRPATFMIELTEVKMGSHEVAIWFIMDHPMVLGLAWLLKQNPSIDWKRNWKSTQNPLDRKPQRKWNNVAICGLLRKQKEKKHSFRLRAGGGNYLFLVNTRDWRMCLVNESWMCSPPPTITWAVQ